MARTIKHENAANTRLGAKRKASRKITTRKNRHGVRQYIRTVRDDEGWQDKPLTICDQGCCF